MGWVIWRDEMGNDGNERRVYVRRITPNFVSFTVDALDARKWDTKTEARRALKGTGLSAYRVSDPDERETIAESVNDDTPPVVAVAPDDPAPAPWPPDMPDMTTADPDAEVTRQAVRDALRADDE